MWDRDFLDKWDMGRRIEARLFCFGSGDNDEPGGGSESRSENNDRDPAQRVASVVGMEPTLVEMAQSATPAQRAANSARNDAIFNEFIANDMMNTRIDEMLAPNRIYGMNDSSGDRRLQMLDIENPMTTGYGPPVPLMLESTPVDISVRSSDSPRIAPLGDPYDEPQVQPTAAEQFRAQESQRAMGLDQRQAGYDAYQAMLGDAVAAAQANVDSATGLLGTPTRFMNQMFIDGMNTRIGGRDSDAYQKYLNDQMLFSPVYNQQGRLTGYRDQYGRLTGTDPITAAAEQANQDDSERQMAPVVNPMTDKPRCPDGYVFDEDLQACRLDVSSSARQTAGPESEIYYRRTALDDAPANLPTGFDFDAANRRFTESYGYRPDFYRSPMSLTGFTRLT